MNKILILFLVLLPLTGCTSYMEVKVNSYAVKNNLGKKFFIPRNNQQDLKLQEHIDHVEDALIDAGYQKSLNLSTADLQIGFNYHMDNSIIICTKPIDVWAASSYYTLALSESCKPWRFRNDYLIDNYYSRFEDSITPRYKTYTPKIIYLYATKADNIDIPIWEIEILNDNSSTDFRNYFPHMLKCASKYFNTNFSGTVTCPYKY